MVTLLHHTPLVSPSISSLPTVLLGHSPPVGIRSFRCRPFSVLSATSSSSTTPTDGRSSNFADFPHLSAPHRSLMLNLFSTVEDRLGSQLHPCALPSDVEYFQNEAGTSRGSLYVRQGDSSSLVDFVLGIWINCQLPTGGELNTTGLLGYLKGVTDAPNFLFEIIRSGPTSLVVLLDLIPRRDLIMHPDYLRSFYQDTNVDSHRQALLTLPEARPYFSPALYIRSMMSPTGSLLKISAGDEEQGRLDEIVGGQLADASKAMLELWLDRCALDESRRDNRESEIAYLEKRDRLVKGNMINVDMESSFPSLFGPENAGRVLRVLREIYGLHC
ncbi:hypothetical protein SAY87_026856 [Trapa incisa]|uniref:Red chlorophyll catabolite reductase n=1 Tax=Trapa incisa TaxID=236973 RepID=A0AAN7JLP1_9MYRT|nr:hypothetical protein SAY87_026856 [Trapa incisa]